MATDRLTFNALTLAEAQSPLTYDRWRDTGRIARMSPAKLLALASNPYASDGSTLAQLLLTTNNDVAARLDIFPGQLLARGRTVPICWGSHLIVSPTYRRQGLARTALQHFRTMFPSVATCGIARDIATLYQELGWTCHHLRRLVLLRRTRSLLLAHAWSASLPHLFRRVADTVIRSPAALLRVTDAYRSSHTLERLAQPPTSLDQHIAANPPTYGFARSTRWLHWLMSNSISRDISDDHGALNDFYLALDGSQEPVGYLLLTVHHYKRSEHMGLGSMSIATLQDFMSFAPGRFTDVDAVTLALRALLAYDVDFIVIHVRNHAVRCLLHVVGFIDAGSLQFPMAPDSTLRLPGFSDTAQWRLRSCDGDNYFN